MIPAECNGMPNWLKDRGDMTHVSLYIIDWIAGEPDPKMLPTKKPNTSMAVLSMKDVEQGQDEELVFFSVHFAITFAIAAPTLRSFG